MVKRDFGDIPLILEYLGSCDEFNADYNTSYVSTFNHGECLPIKTVAPFNHPDIDDLISNYVCTPIVEGKSIIHFVEILNGTVPQPNFVFSFIPSFAFRALGGNRYMRRPNCDIAEDVCTSFEFATSCSENFIEMRGSYVINKDRIYVFPNGVSANSCVFQGNPCPYINSTMNFGMCAYEAPTELLLTNSPFFDEAKYLNQNDNDGFQRMEYQYGSR